MKRWFEKNYANKKVHTRHLLFRADLSLMITLILLSLSSLSLMITVILLSLLLLA